MSTTIEVDEAVVKHGRITASECSVHVGPKDSILVRVPELDGRNYVVIRIEAPKGFYSASRIFCSVDQALSLVDALGSELQKLPEVAMPADAI